MKPFRKKYLLKDGKELILRTPKLGDEKELINQMKIVDRETRFLAREDGELEFTSEQEKEFIETILSEEKRLLLVAVVDDKIVGNCSVRLISNSLRYLHRASMGIAICKEYWEKGIGRQMIWECINWSKNEGFEQLELEVVTDNNRAIPIYEKFGFEIQTTMKHSMKYLDGSYADEFIMILFL